ncbi:MAG: metalloregulator ArsR/SmtB family transcription factor [Spirochaetes bacterium]|nr:metalloregulator ArsR/SmtB family transcription factor [Spirochaetota bacterium]
MEETLSLLKALADESRLRVLSLLLEAEDLCSCEIEAILGLTQSNTSRHLTRLRYAGLVHSYKRGQWVHFRLASQAWSTHPYLAQVLESARADLPAAADDLARLHSYQGSGFSCATIDQWAAANPTVFEAYGK